MKKPHELFQESHLIIVDENALRRERLKRMALSLGFDASKISLAPDGEEGLALAMEYDVSFAIVDDSIGYTALARLHAHFDERQVRDPHSLLFFVSEVASRGIVGRMAEEGVDDFIFRPYSQAQFKEIFINAVDRKLNPSPSAVRMREGREKLMNGQIEDARKTWTLGLPEAGESTATYYYFLGQAAIAEQKYDEAVQHFSSGLNSNPIHFRCLQGLFQVRMMQDQVEEAYQALRRLSDAYPENPERLMTYVKMAVAGAHYRDLEKVDDIYRPMELKADGLKKHLAAGHAVLGRSLCVQKNLQSALKAFARAIELSDEASNFILYSIESLEKYGFNSDATIFRQKYGLPAAPEKQAA